MVSATLFFNFFLFCHITFTLTLKKHHASEEHLITNQRIKRRSVLIYVQWKGDRRENSLLQLDDSVVFEERGDVSHESPYCVCCLSSLSCDLLLSMQKKWNKINLSRYAQSNSMFYTLHYLLMWRQISCFLLCLITFMYAQTFPFALTPK